MHSHNADRQATIQPSQQRDQFLAEALAGLRAFPKRLPCKHFYDQRGSELFDQICELDEYYLTRCELSIMQRYASEMGQQIGEGVRLVEYGSGSSIKTRLLLDQLPSPVAYVPVDISREHLLDVADQLQDDYRAIEIRPVVADFTRPFDVPAPSELPTHTAVYFPGSTIGNFEECEAVSLLENIALLCGVGGGLLVGVDLEKEKAILELAYDDPAGVTADFNLNLLQRLKNELDADIDLDGFEHHAFYNEKLARIEIYIRSVKDQTVQIEGDVFSFVEGELIHTEYSHKYTVERFTSMAQRAGFDLRKSWTDDREYFAVLHLVVARSRES